MAFKIYFVMEFFHGHDRTDLEIVEAKINTVPLANIGTLGRNEQRRL